MSFFLSSSTFGVYSKGLLGERARRRAVEHALRDSLADRRDAEQVVGEIEVPVRRRHAGPPGALAVILEIGFFGRNSESLEIEPRHAAELVGRDVPAHAVVGKIGERIAERRQLPVEHRENPRFHRMENQVVEAVVAMHHRRAGLGRNVMGQPGDKMVHGLDFRSLRGAVLPAPALHLPCDVVARLAEGLEPDRTVIDRMQERDDAVLLVPDAGALGARHPGKRRVPEHASLDIVHDVERGADHALVLAQHLGSRDRKTNSM